MKYIATLLVALAVGFSNCEAGEGQRFYTLFLHYNSERETVVLSCKPNPIPFSVDKYRFTEEKDWEDENSQFFAQVIGKDGQAKQLQGRNKFFLGRWKLIMFWDGPNGGGSKEVPEGEVRVSVPYFPNGKEVRIFNVRSGKLALTVYPQNYR